MAVIVGARLHFRSDSRGVGLPIAFGRTDLKNGGACCSCLSISADGDV
jgi:hypothetical protein